MATKNIKTKTITVEQKKGTFRALFSRFKIEKTDKTADISALRSLMSNEKARILHVLKTQQPNSIYKLAKILGRGFKAVRQDMTVLEEFGFVEMIPIHKGKREKLKPLIVLDELDIKFKL